MSRRVLSRRGVSGRRGGSKNVAQVFALPKDGWSIFAKGHWGSGGIAILSNGEFEEPIDLAPALLDSLAVLVLEAKRSGFDGTSPDTGFVTIDKMCHQLKRQTAATQHPLLPDRHHVNTYILRLRKTFAAVISGLPASAWESVSVDSVEYEWAKQLFPNHQYLGYRVLIAADRLSLDISEPRDEETFENDRFTPQTPPH